MLYKEWIKTRWYLLAAFAVLGGFAGYALVKLHRAAALMGAGHVWEVMVTRNAVFIDQMEYLPLLVGLLLAAVQFVPEMQRKSLKLTLHLPVPALATLTAMVGCGTAALLLLFGLCILLLAAGASPVLPHELVWNILSTALPWCLAGVAAYLFGAWTILEPTWKRRLVNILMSVLLLRDLLPRAWAAGL